MLVGIDIGTQSLKAVVADHGLGVRGHGASAYGPSFPRPGWAEQDPELWERALPDSIAQALAAAGAVAGDVTGLGIAGQLDGCVAVDAAGRALAPCLIWMDRRAGEEIRGLDPDHVRSVTGSVLDPGHMAAKIRWLKGQPACRTAVRFHQPVSYLVARLTGAHVFDHALASTTLLYDLETRDFDPGLLAAFGIAREELPAIAPADAVAGHLSTQGARLSGLPRGIPVAVGTGDDFSTPLGGGLAEPGRVVCVLGTAEVVGALHEDPVIDAGSLVETHGYVTDTYFIENPGWLCGGALKWLRETLAVDDFATLDRLAAAASPGAGGLSFLPAMSGAMAPEWIASARGCFYGLTPAHGRGDMARAVLEGCAFAMRDVVERLSGMGVRADSLLALGGGARSRPWAQIRADTTGIPVHRPARVDTSPLGAAILAAVAAGALSGTVEGARAVDATVEVIEPRPENRAAYDRAYGAYRRLFDALRPMYESTRLEEMES